MERSQSPHNTKFETMIFRYSDKFSRGKISHKVTFNRLLLDRTDFEIQPLNLLLIQNICALFLIGLKANWWLPYLEDASNIPSIPWYTFHCKRGK